MKAAVAWQAYQVPLGMAVDTTGVFKNLPGLPHARLV